MENQDLNFDDAFKSFDETRLPTGGLTENSLIKKKKPEKIAELNKIVKLVTKNIEKVLKEGYPAVKGNSKYDEVIPIMSKYIRPEILTPDFFERYWDAMNQVFYFAGNPIYRIRQFDGVGRGIFALWDRYMFEGKIRKNPAADVAFSGAGEYAQAAAKTKMGEFEDYFWRDLNDIQTIEFRSREAKELVSLIAQNILPKYRTENGYKIYQEEEDKPLFPVVVKIKTKLDNFGKRVVGDIRPEEIIGISFAEKGEPENLLSKEDFLKEYHARLKQPQKICSHNKQKELNDPHTRV